MLILHLVPDVVPSMDKVLVTFCAVAGRSYGKVATLLAVSASGGFLNFQ